METLLALYKYQLIQQVVQVGGADAAGVEVEIPVEGTANLADAAFGGVPVPLICSTGYRLANTCHAGSNEGAYVVATAHLNLLAGQDDGRFRMAGANHAKGFQPTDAGGYYIPSCLFFNATLALVFFFLIIFLF